MLEIGCFKEKKKKKTKLIAYNWLKIYHFLWVFLVGWWVVFCTGRRLGGMILGFWFKIHVGAFPQSCFKNWMGQEGAGLGFLWVVFFFVKEPCHVKRAVSGNPVPFMLSFMNFSLSHFLLLHSVAPFLAMQWSGSSRSSVCGCKYCGNISSFEHSDNAFAYFLIEHLFFFLSSNEIKSFFFFILFEVWRA